MEKISHAQNGTGASVAWWRYAAPVVLACLVLASPTPEGLAPQAWRYFSIFVAIIVALILEPRSNPAVGLIGVVLVAACSQWVLFSPADIAIENFNLTVKSLEWALSGFSNSIVWLVFSAFMFATGYEKTGLGRRIALALVRRMGANTSR